MINAERVEVLPRVVEDTRSYYWLGFTPQRARDDQRHEVSVVLANPEFRVRLRSGFLDSSRDTEVSMAKMGRDFARFNQGQPLTRERLRQWRKALGVRVTFYEVEPVVRKVLDSTVVKSTREQ